MIEQLGTRHNYDIAGLVDLSKFSKCLTYKLDSQPPPIHFFSFNAEENGNLETFLTFFPKQCHLKNLRRSFPFYVPRFIVYNFENLDTFFHNKINK